MLKWARTWRREDQIVERKIVGPRAASGWEVPK